MLTKCLAIHLIVTIAELGRRICARPDSEFFTLSQFHAGKNLPIALPNWAGVPIPLRKLLYVALSAFAGSATAARIAGIADAANATSSISTTPAP